VSTRKAYLKGIRRFVSWAVKEGELPANEVASIPSPALGKTLPPSITMETHEAILATCDPKTLIGKRDIALLMMLLTSGCRASELVGLQLADVTVRTRRALVHGKGRQDRVVAYTSETALALDRYIRARRLHKASAGMSALWLSQRGAPLTYWGLDSMVERRALLAEVGPVHAHQWRHLWARTFLRDSGNRDALKLLGGWKSDEMVEHYTQVDAAERALEVYDRVYGGRQA
jgi:site-specific recombinase XerD